MIISYIPCVFQAIPLLLKNFTLYNNHHLSSQRNLTSMLLILFNDLFTYLTNQSDNSPFLYSILRVRIICWVRSIVSRLLLTKCGKLAHTFYIAPESIFLLMYLQAYSKAYSTYLGRQLCFPSNSNPWEKSRVLIYFFFRTMCLQTFFNTSQVMQLHSSAILNVEMIYFKFISLKHPRSSASIVSPFLTIEQFTVTFSLIPNSCFLFSQFFLTIIENQLLNAPIRDRDDMIDAKLCGVEKANIILNGTSKLLIDTVVFALERWYRITEQDLIF